MCLKVMGAIKKKKPNACSGRFHQGGIFRSQALQAGEVGEPRRAAQPWAARSSTLSAPLGDTTCLEDQAQKNVCPGCKPRQPASRSLFGGFTSASTLHALSALENSFFPHKD